MYCIEDESVRGAKKTPIRRVLHARVAVVVAVIRLVNSADTAIAVNCSEYRNRPGIDMSAVGSR